MKRTRKSVLLVALLAAAASVMALAAASTASANVGPAFESLTNWGDTNLAPGGQGQIVLHMHNVGDESPNDTLKIVEEVPEGVTIKQVTWDFGGFDVMGYFLSSGYCNIQDERLLECNLPSFFLGEVLGFSPPGDKATYFAPSPSGWTAPIYIDVLVSPTASGTGINRLKFEGGGAVAPHEEVVEIPFGSTPSGFGVAQFMADVFAGPEPDETTTRIAGDHPYELRVNFDLNKKTGVDPQDGTRYIAANGTIKTAEVTLPRGVVGNPEATPKCDPAKFAESGSVLNSTLCPANTQVGYLNIHATNGTTNYGRGKFIFNPYPDGILQRVPLYNLEPPKGVPADFAFNAGGFVQGHIYPELDPSQNYAIKTVSPEIASMVQPSSVEVVIWGVPGDPSHDKFRYFGERRKEDEAAVGAPFEGKIRPLLTNPMDCDFHNGGARIRVESYEHPGDFSPLREYGNALDVSGCDDPRVRFDPRVSMQPDNTDAGGPTGLDVHLEVPQRNDEVESASDLYAANGDEKGIATPPIKKAVVTLPEGMTLSPSAAQGLGTCTAAQIGLGTNSPVTCPDSSQYGRLILHTPILPQTAQPEGWIYIAKQGENPFHNFLALYLVIQEPDRGILIKIPGRLDLDSRTGQITTTFDDLPQFPVSDMELRFKGGVRAGLVNPSTCGTKTIRAEFFSWAAPASPRVADSSYEITNGPGGAPCAKSLADRQFKPTMDAGTESPQAGSYSPFVFNLKRDDSDQEFSQVRVELPAGLSAKFAGVGMCSEAGIAQAEGRTGAGDAAHEQLEPSCPASSQIGTTQVGTGVGVPLTYVPGKIYLAGPYKGAPLSMVVISPVVVGPYDLGVLAVRTALQIDPETARATAVSDPFPLIYQGIPVRIRDIRLEVDRPNFTLNPTSCLPKQIGARITGTGGDLFGSTDDVAVSLAQRFQVTDCDALRFSPKLRFRLFGGKRRGAHPRLEAILKARDGDANLAQAAVTLPHSEFLDQSHIRTVCTRVQFAARACPAASIYGFAKARTPLFDKPLEGPVYLRSSSHTLPDLVAALRGPAAQPVEIDLAARIDSVGGGIRSSFEIVPDAPVSEFRLTMQGGKKGLLQNSTNLCRTTYRAKAKLTAQNGVNRTLRPKIGSSCAKRKGR
jgi:hypothetical protein